MDNKYMQYMRQDEPILSGAVIGSLILGLVDNVFHLTEGQLSLYGIPCLIVGGIIFRQLVYSPSSFFRALYTPPPDGADGDPEL